MPTTAKADSKLLMNETTTTRRPMGITRVQQWIATALLFTTLEHFAAGMVIAAFMMDPSRNSSRVGLIVMSAITGLMAVAGSRLILQKPVISAWFALAAVWPLFGIWLIYWR